MREPGQPPGTGIGRGEDFSSLVRSLLEEFGLTNAGALAETVSLNSNHPLWAVWLPAVGRGWVAVRPAGSRPPGPEVPMLWVIADSATELSARMRFADAALEPPGYGR